MSNPETLLQATLNRLAARLGQGFIDIAAGIAVKAQDAPEKLQKEWELFQEEVFAEANRLDQNPSEENTEEITTSKYPENENPQDKIDLLRAKIAKLNKKIEVKN